MKRLAAIFLCFLILFNAVGFYTLLLGLQYKNALALQHRFDRNAYDERKAVLIKIPLAVPYAIDQPDYVRVNGKFEHNGEFFRLVKQKLSKDTLHIVCVRDTEAKRLHDELKDHVRTFTDSPASDQSSKISNNLIKDYFSPVFSILSHTAGWNHTITSNSTTADLIASYCGGIIHPPDCA